MERKIRKKILAIVLIVAILASDFLVLESSLRTYANNISSETNNPNVKFFAYFKNKEGKKTDSIEKSVKSEDLKLYAQIEVKNEGYFNGTIEIQDSNFNLKNEISSSNTHISSIQGNKVNLKQINAGEVVEVELGIEPAITDKIESDMLSKISIVKLNGSYTASTNGGIQYGREVCLTLRPDETATAQLTTDIITNKVFSINEVNKKVVQLLIKSKISENQYPLKQTTLKVEVPELSEKQPELVDVLVVGEVSENRTREINSNSWKNEDGIVEINLNNEIDNNNEISWNKKVYDEVVVTFIYEEDVDTSEIEITTNSDVIVHNIEKKYTATDTVVYTETTESKELNNIIMSQSKVITNEIYKGQLYANINADKKQNIPYNTLTELIITNKDITDEIIINEGQDAFVMGESELNANAKYISTEINKQDMLALLGQEGEILIKSAEKTTIINKDTEVNENGNIEIIYEDNTTELYIKTSKPLNAGTIEINHTKAITKNDYTRKQLKEVKRLKTKSSVEGIATVNEEKINVIENSTNASIELKETISKAELSVNREKLSTTEDNKLTIGIKLITDGMQYDLYKNPTLKIQLPKVVENVELIEQPSKLYADEFKINSRYDSSNKIIEIKLDGEQTEYPQSSVTQLYLQLKLNVTLSKLATTQTEKITMTYTNENASQYDSNTTESGIVEQEIGISGTGKLVPIFNLDSNKTISLDDNMITQQVTDMAGKELDFEIILLNDTNSDMKNVKILGKLPTTGNAIDGKNENTLPTTLTGIQATGARVYYTENGNATLGDIEREWTEDLSSLTNPKLYLIEVGDLSKGTYVADVKVKIPQILNKNVASYTEYKVIYDTGTETKTTVDSGKIGLLASSVATLEPKLTATVGGEELKNGDVLKEGEVIKYKVTVENKGTQTLENLQIKASVPEGTVLVEPMEDENGDGDIDYIYEEGYYLEKPEIKEKIDTITLGEDLHTMEYEVRVNKGTVGKEILNQVKVIYEDSAIESEVLKNVIEESDIRITLKNTNVETKIVPGSLLEYTVYIENLSNKKITDLNMQILSENFEYVIRNNKTYDIKTEVISINEIEPNTTKTLKLSARIKQDTIEKISAVIKVLANGNTYRSNEIIKQCINANGTITLSSNPQSGSIIKEGDYLTYTIELQNTGDTDELFIDREISDYLQIQEIKIDGKTDSKINIDRGEFISNSVNTIHLNIKPGESKKIEIITKVIATPKESITITNRIKVMYSSIYEITTSNEVTHILNGSSIPEADEQNTVSGLVWLDKNENAQKDNGEIGVENIVVKLYDISTNSYLATVKTNSNGEYVFSEIKDGSYVIIIETEQESTTNQSQKIVINGETIIVIATEAIEVKEHVHDINIGLKEKNENDFEGDNGEDDGGNGNEGEDNGGNGNEGEDNGGNENEGEDNGGNENEGEDNGGNENEGEDNRGNENEGEDNGGNENEGEDNSGNSENDNIEVENKKSISGFAWLDSNKNGQKDSNETPLSGINVRLYACSTKNYLKDSDGKIVQTSTDANGKYIFENIENGKYIVLFKYDMEKYEPIKYSADGDSKVVLNKIQIDGQENIFAVTDIINVQSNISNINIGLSEKLIFDLELNKYISRIVVQNGKETKTYDYENATLAKVEIHRNKIQGSLVVLEYTIKIKNNGEVAGYAKNIIDYLPKGLTFSSELNTDWYLSGNNLHTKGLENVAINPGEEKEIKLILTKIMTNENIGLINNRAEIYQDYNKYGNSDIDSTPNNQAQDEDDFGTVDVIIGISTGGTITVYIILMFVNIFLIRIAIGLMKKNKIIEIETKEERR